MSLSKCSCPSCSASTDVPQHCLYFAIARKYQSQHNGCFCPKADRSDIDGIFSNHEGNDLLQFSKPTHVESTIHTELLIVRKGLLMVVTSHWASSFNFVWGSDSQTVIAWLVDHSSTP